MKELTITSVDEFHRAIRATWAGHPVYRGENESSYALRSKVGRYQIKNAKNTPATERNILDEFKKRAVPFLQSVPSNNWEWLALAQHHGLPTRLLDWTLNPLVAAYFATHDSYLADSVIYVIQRFELPHADETVDPFEMQNDVIYMPRHSAARFVAQRGLFTVHHDPRSPFSHESLEKWTIKKPCLIELNGMLRVYGVSQSTVFPGLDGICAEMTYTRMWR